MLSLSGASENDLSVPLPAVIAQQGKDAVFVYDAKAGTVVRRAVKLGPIEGERIRVTSGLRSGEQVVAAGGAFLSDGQAVLPLRAASHLNDAGRP